MKITDQWKLTFLFLLLHHADLPCVSVPTCVDGLEEAAGVCYSLHPSPVINFWDAEKECENMGGRLAVLKTIDSAKKFQEIITGGYWWQLTLHQLAFKVKDRVYKCLKRKNTALKSCA